MIDETIIANMMKNVNKKHTATARNRAETAYGIRARNPYMDLTFCRQI
jgi:hypothetical protein